MAPDINSDLLAPTPYPIRCTPLTGTLLLPLYLATFWLWPTCPRRLPQCSSLPSQSPSTYCPYKSAQHLLIVVGRVKNFLTPRSLHPWKCKYVTLHGKRDFEDVIKLRTLRWGDYTGFIQVSPIKSQDSFQAEEGSRRGGWGEAIGGFNWLILKMEEGGLEPRNVLATRNRKWKGDGFSSITSRKDPSLPRF